MLFRTLTFCKRSTRTAFTPVLSKSRFSNSERNSGTFRSQIFRDSNVSDITTSNPNDNLKNITTRDYKYFTYEHVVLKT